jgi:hypothetical protein
MPRVAPPVICFIVICALGACAAEKAGVPAVIGIVDRSSAATAKAAAAHLASLHGTIENVTSARFVLRTNDGKVSVDLSWHTVVRGRLRNGRYAQVVGRGARRDRARYVAVWRSPPPQLTLTGRIAGSSELGFSLERAGSPATIVVIASSTKTPPALQAGEEVTVVGFGSPARGIVAARISPSAGSPSPSPSASAAPSPTVTPVSTATPNPTPTPTPGPTPEGISLQPGKVVGEDDMFAPPDGDSSTGGQSQAIDGIPCVPSMYNNYHVHVYVGLYVNGKQMAIPDQIGMYQPGQISNGYTNTATCFYYIHTHDASGMIHIESPEDQPVSASIYTLQNVLDVWGMTVGPNNVGPFTGTVRTFIGRAKLGTTTVSPTSYAEYFGDPNAIALYSHEAIWFEVGPPYYTPPYIPEIVFYNEY